MVLRETAVSAPHLRGGRTAMLQARPARHVGEGRFRPRPVRAKEDVHGVHAKKEFNDEEDDEVPIGAAKGASKKASKGPSKGASKGPVAAKAQKRKEEDEDEDDDEV